MKKQYKGYLLEFGYKEKYLLEERVFFCSASFMQIRDTLFRIGRILKEDIENEVYVVSIKSGFLKCNNAIVVCGLEKDNLRMISFAREGVIKQNTCKKAMDTIEKFLKY